MEADVSCSKGGINSQLEDHGDELGLHLADTGEDIGMEGVGREEVGHGLGDDSVELLASLGRLAAMRA